MANTKITSRVIADNSVGIDALNVTDGTNGQYLQTDGSGTLSFSTISGYTDSDVATYLGGGTSTPTFSTAIVTGDLTVDTNTLYVDSTNNRVGIGTTSPNSKTHIVGAANGIALRVTNAAVDGNNADVMHIEPSNGAYYGKLLRIQSGRSDFSDSLLFLNTTTGMNGTNGSYMRVQNNSGADIFRSKGDGNVGIGTDNPAYPLSVMKNSN